MEVKIIEEKKTKLHAEISDSPAIAMNLLKNELWNNSNVKIVGTNTSHPLLKVQTIILETDGTDPKKVISASAKKLHKILDKAAESLKNVR